jgi:hypothetical protein
MKTKYFIQLAIFLVFCTFSSCDVIEKADDISFDATVPISVFVNETASSSGGSFSKTQTMDLASDPDVAKYVSKIKEFKVNKITYTISGANPDSVTLTNVTIKNASGGKTIAIASSISLSNTTETPFTTNSSGIDELNAALLADKQGQIEFLGTLSSTPVTFTLTIKFYLTITANVL